jgi:two-component system CheB/CheR fusion protein
MKQRIFRKVPRSTMRSRLLAINGARLLSPEEDTDEVRTVELRTVELGFEHRPTSEVLIDGAGIVIGANAAARAAFALAADVIGRPFQDLQLSYRPVELRSYIDEAQASGHSVRIADVERVTAEGTAGYLDVEVVPLAPNGGPLLGFLLSFTDVTAQRTVRDELENTHRELQSTVEELETTNEELQSTVEELETMNEELQSTNEELETMNEELSSTNEELHAMNLELSDRTSEVGRVNAYMESVLNSLQASVVVVDRDLQVRVWDGLSFELWGLRSDEVEGRSFLDLDIGFPVEQLGTAIHACLRTGESSEPLVAAAANRRGHHITCRARVSPLRGGNGDLDGAIILIEQERPDPGS